MESVCTSSPSAVCPEAQTVQRLLGLLGGVVETLGSQAPTNIGKPSAGLVKVLAKMCDWASVFDDVASVRAAADVKIGTVKAKKLFAVCEGMPDFSAGLGEEALLNDGQAERLAAVEKVVRVSVASKVATFLQSGLVEPLNKLDKFAAKSLQLVTDIQASKGYAEVAASASELIEQTKDIAALADSLEEGSSGQLVTNRCQYLVRLTRCMRAMGAVVVNCTAVDEVVTVFSIPLPWHRWRPFRVLVIAASRSFKTVTVSILVTASPCAHTGARNVLKSPKTCHYLFANFPKQYADIGSARGISKLVSLSPSGLLRATGGCCIRGSSLRVDD